MCVGLVRAARGTIEYRLHGVSGCGLPANPLFLAVPPIMYVVKRDGRHEEVQLDKITARIRNLTEGLDKRYIDPVCGAAAMPWPFHAPRAKMLPPADERHAVRSCTDG